MQTLTTFVVLSRLAVGLCITGSLTSMPVVDVLAQSAAKRTTYSEVTSVSRSQINNPKAGTMLARNATHTSEAVVVASTAKTSLAPDKIAKKHDPKAVGRCWNRLMEMIREARIAHRRTDD
jgi:hypothetical protein